MVTVCILADTLAAVRCPDATHQGAIQSITVRKPLIIQVNGVPHCASCNGEFLEIVGS
jgi:hypothetical protein